MNKFKTLLISTLLLSSVSVVNLARADDKTTAKKDRQAIVITTEERRLVMMEMRGFLESVQTIISSLATEDWKNVAKAAKKSGHSEQAPMPDSLKKKLPKAFKKLGGKTHKAFDALALESKDMEDKQQTLEQLGALMKNCTSCHALFKFETTAIKVVPKK